MRHLVPVLTEVVIRAWGLDDPRVLSMLRAENTPGRSQRIKAVGQRAHRAGWPVETTSMHLARQAQIRALRRLERMDWSHQGRRAAHLAGKTASDGFIDPWVADDPVTIFDE
jgi:hypothetical protein